MAYSNIVGFESKVFEISRDGRYVFIIERGWKVVKELSLGTASARWFSKVLEDCMKFGS